MYAQIVLLRPLSLKPALCWQLICKKRHMWPAATPECEKDNDIGAASRVHPFTSVSRHQMKRLIIHPLGTQKDAGQGNKRALLTDNKMLIYSCVTSACHISSTIKQPHPAAYYCRRSMCTYIYIYIHACACGNILWSITLVLRSFISSYTTLSLRQSNYGFVLQCPLKFCEQAFCSASTSCRLHTCAFVCQDGAETRPLLMENR